MACIEKIYSVSAVIGSGACNADCPSCAGRYLRPQAAQQSDSYWKNYEAAIKLSARHGGWSLSLTGAGEPTMSPESVTRALSIYGRCASQGAYMPNVNLFTNGIRFADKAFCVTHLSRWRELGLTNVCLSFYGPTQMMQSRAYGVEYPQICKIVDNIKTYGDGIGVRATLLLRRGDVDSVLMYRESVRTIIEDHGIRNITSWAVCNPDGTRNEWTPSRLDMLSIRMWLRRNAKLCHGHVWGGGVYDYNGSILRITDYVSRHSPSNDFVRQLVVFQDGVVAYSWIREGALCMI